MERVVPRHVVRVEYRRTLAVRRGYIFAYLCARIDLKVWKVGLAEGKVHEAEQGSQLLVTTALKERDEISKLVIRLLDRLVFSRVGEQGRPAIVEAGAVVVGVGTLELDTRFLRRSIDVENATNYWTGQGSRREDDEQCCCERK